MKDKKIKGNRISNAYLFVNLVLIVVLLIGLWTKTSVWEAKLDLGGVILLLIIINTLLLFKEIIVGIAPKSEKTTHTKPKSLNALRAIINSSSAIVDEKAIAASVEKLKEISNCDFVDLIIFENNQSTSRASSGELPQLLNGSKLVLNERTLSIKYTGQLGTEEICKLSDTYSPIRFKSALTRLKLILIPMNLSHARLGVCVMYKSDSPFKMHVSLGSVAVLFESLISLVEGYQTTTGGYKDKETGLILYKNFEELVDNELERSERYEQEMSLLSIKISDFEKLKDSEKPQVCKNVNQWRLCRYRFSCCQHPRRWLWSNYPSYWQR